MEKLEMQGGFKESALRINSYVVKQTTWNEEKIKERSNELCEMAKKIWKYPELTENEVAELLPDDKPEAQYTLEDYEYLTNDILNLYHILNKRIMNISSSIKQELKRNYIAYKVDTNFVDIVSQKSRFRLSLNMKFSEINDEKGLCKDVTEKGRLGNGDIEIALENQNQIEEVMELIIQSFNKQID